MKALVLATIECASANGVASSHVCHRVTSCRPLVGSRIVEHARRIDNVVMGAFGQAHLRLANNNRPLAGWAPPVSHDGVDDDGGRAVGCTMPNTRALTAHAAHQCLMDELIQKKTSLLRNIARLKDENTWLLQDLARLEAERPAFWSWLRWLFGCM